MLIELVSRVKLHVAEPTTPINLAVLVHEGIGAGHLNEQRYLPPSGRLLVKVDILNWDSPVAEKTLGFPRAGTLLSTVDLSHDGIVDDETVFVLLLLSHHWRKHGKDPRPRGATK